MVRWTNILAESATWEVGIMLCPHRLGGRKLSGEGGGCVPNCEGRGLGPSFSPEGEEGGRQVHMTKVRSDQVRGSCRRGPPKE